MKLRPLHVCLLICGVSLPSRADVKPAALFSDHMVLQSGVEAPVWGWASPGEDVTVSVGNQHATTKASDDGKWMVKLAKHDAGEVLEMTVAGKNSVTIKDILVGEVWLGSGQSNMEFTVSKNVQKYPGLAKPFAGVNDEEKEIAAADFPQIRMFTVKSKYSEKPLDDVEGQWQVCTPETVPGFSAVGYFFSRDLYKAVNRPVGFINSSVGASCAQAWISQDVLAADAKFKPVLDSFTNAKAQYEQALAARARNPQPPATQDARGRRGGGAPRSPLTDQHQPFLLYNGMIKGIQPYAIKGAIWYQGESITTGGPAMYTQLMNTLITSWRTQWNRGAFPFYFVQLAALDQNSNRPEVREAQARSLMVLNTAMAVTIDIGDKGNVHPKNKQDLGARLSRIASARDYGQKLEWSGPMYESMVVEGNAIRVRFSHSGAGLVSKDEAPKTFQIAGEDKKFVDATAKIEGDSIVVSSDKVNSPKAVRYAWNRWPEGCNLYNADGLPAAPFRTDDW